MGASGCAAFRVPVRRGDVIVFSSWAGVVAFFRAIGGPPQGDGGVLPAGATSGPPHPGFVFRAVGKAPEYGGASLCSMERASIVAKSPVRRSRIGDYSVASVMRTIWHGACILSLHRVSEVG